MKYPFYLLTRIRKIKEGSGEGYLDNLILPQSGRSLREQVLRPTLPPSPSPASDCGMCGSPGGACGQNAQLSAQLLLSWGNDGE